MQLSFIVIGKNEGDKLQKSLFGLNEIVKKNKTDFELIYVDSNSADNSIDIAKQFQFAKILKIFGYCNSAIARNYGARISKGKLLFFIDGDMEIEIPFINEILKLDWNNTYQYVTGHILDVLYDSGNNLIGTEPRSYVKEVPSEVEILNTNGGSFVILRSLWELIGGMKSKFKRSQDLDFCLRLIAHNYQIKRIPILMAKHHTISYQDKNRMWKNFIEGYCLYSALLFRNHIGKLNVWKKILREQYTAIMLFLVLIAIIINGNIAIGTFALSGVMSVARTVVKLQKSNLNDKNLVSFFNRLINQYLMDIQFIVGFFFFFNGITPKKTYYQIIRC